LALAVLTIAFAAPFMFAGLSNLRGAIVNGFVDEVPSDGFPEWCPPCPLELSDLPGEMPSGEFDNKVVAKGSDSERGGTLSGVGVDF
jgi:hypothetical protein